MINKTYDFLVAGGGYSGICAAIAAGRQGLKTVLIEKEMFLGGNGGPNLGVGSTGVMGCNPYFNESGIIEEIEEEINRQGARLFPTNFGYNINPMWDNVVSQMLFEAGVTVLRKHLVIECKTENNKIVCVTILNIENLDKTEIVVNGLCVDATGDAHLAQMAGAETRMGREGKCETGERTAPENPDDIVSTASITALVVDSGKPCIFVPPVGTPKWNPEKPDNHFDPCKRIHFLWQVDEGGENDQNHPLYTPQQLYLNLQSRIYSVWHYLKNVKFKEECKNHQLVWISPILGRRESHRIIGDYLLTQTDIENCVEFKDKIAFAGAYMDEHMPSFDGGYEVRFYTRPVPYDIPFRCLYSKNIDNLFSAGRNIGVSHLAFTSTRLMRTCGVLGQVVGIAAKLCMDKNCTPRELCQNHINELQGLLIKNDVGILGDVPPLERVDIIASNELALSREKCNGHFIKAKEIGAALYSYNDYIEKFSLYIRNIGIEKEVEGILAYGETMPIEVFDVPDFAYDEQLGKYVKVESNDKNATKNITEGIENPTGTAGWDEFYKRDDNISDYMVVATDNKIIPEGFEGFVEFEVKNKKAFKKYDRRIIGQAIKIAVCGDVEVLTARHNADVVVGLIDGVESEENVPVFKVYPEIIIGKAENILNGKVTREGRANSNSWICEVPASIVLNCEKEISEISVKFDKNEKLWKDMYLQKGDAVAGRQVCNYTIEGYNGKWQELVNITGNYHQFNMHKINRAYYNKIKLTILKMWDADEPARILEIRVD